MLLQRQWLTSVVEIFILFLATVVTVAPVGFPIDLQGEAEAEERPGESVSGGDSSLATAQLQLVALGEVEGDREGAAVEEVVGREKELEEEGEASRVIMGLLTELLSKT